MTGTINTVTTASENSTDQSHDTSEHVYELGATWETFSGTVSFSPWLLLSASSSFPTWNSDELRNHLQGQDEA